MMAEAMVKLRIGEQMVQVAADGNGPVSALDAAVRTLIETPDGIHRWRTVGASTDVIEASWLALQDAYEYWILHWGNAEVPAAQ